MFKFQEKLSEVFSNASRNIQRKVQYLKERIQEFFGALWFSGTAEYSEIEQRLISRSAELLYTYFGSSPGENLLQEDVESRRMALEDFGRELADSYGLEDVEIVITDLSKVYPYGEGVCYYGCADLENGKIYVNDQMLHISDGQVLEHLISTVIHELRHIMQIRAVRRQNTYGINRGILREWKRNMNNYIDAEKDYEEYIKQPLELDARDYTSRVWRMAYDKSVR